MKRTLVALAVIGLMLVGVAPAAAHVQVVDPPGQAEGKVGWVGGPVLPDAAQGEGLIGAGPGGIFGLQSPAHDGGLVAACVALRGHGNAAVDIFGPTAPNLVPTCRHGSQPVD